MSPPQLYPRSSHSSADESEWANKCKRREKKSARLHRRQTKWNEQENEEKSFLHWLAGFRFAFHGWIYNLVDSLYGVLWIESNASWAQKPKARGWDRAERKGGREVEKERKRCWKLFIQRRTTTTTTTNSVACIWWKRANTQNPIWFIHKTKKPANRLNYNNEQIRDEHKALLCFSATEKDIGNFQRHFKPHKFTLLISHEHRLRFWICRLDFIFFSFFSCGTNREMEKNIRYEICAPKICLAKVNCECEHGIELAW